jgi:hypothetical protein
MPGLTCTTFILYVKGLEDTRLVFSYPYSVRLTEHNYVTGHSVKITDRNTEFMPENTLAKIISIRQREGAALFASEVVELEIVLDRLIDTILFKDYSSRWIFFMSKGFPVGWILVRDQCIYKTMVST